MAEADEKCYNEVRKDAASRAVEGGPPPAMEMEAAEEPGAGRPRQPRFLLREPRPLADMQTPIVRAKLSVPAFAGDSPPKEPRIGRGQVSSTARCQRKKYAAWWVVNSKPWGEMA